MDSTHSLTLHTGAAMPLVGLGTWKSDPQRVGGAVEYALTECSYRHIDCAWIHQSEKAIGKAFKKVFDARMVHRDDVFITGKLWNSFHASDRVAEACKESLRDLHLEYLDLYLMHWGIATPQGELEPLDENNVLLTENIPVRETWEAMQDLVKTGLVKAIGVANFSAAMIVDLLSYARLLPAVNQIELHPYHQQARLVEYCRYKGIVVTAYSPLGRPDAEPPRPFLKGDSSARLIDNVVITEIAARHKKTPAQILLRWAVQRKTVVIPKSVTPARIKENIDVFDFELTDEEMNEIATLDRGRRYVDPYNWWKVPYFG